MTHDALIERTVRWLRNTQRCRYVLTEAWTRGEIPDAIGWRRGTSIVVECKVSMADFRADRRKPWREARGLGRLRYYLTPPGLLMPDCLPALWGLLECHPKQLRRVRRAREMPIGWWNYHAELDLLARRLAREGWQV